MITALFIAAGALLAVGTALSFTRRFEPLGLALAAFGCCACMAAEILYGMPEWVVLTSVTGLAFFAVSFFYEATIGRRKAVAK